MNFLGLLNVEKKSSNTILSHRWVHTFPKGVCTKINLIVQLEFELAYFEAAVLHYSH